MKKINILALIALALGLAACSSTPKQEEQPAPVASSEPAPVEESPVDLGASSTGRAR